MENTLASVDLGRYRRIVQMFWDPEPVNDVSTDQPVWCLGKSYRLCDGDDSKPVGKTNKRRDSPPVVEDSPPNGHRSDATHGQVGTVPVPPLNTPNHPPESTPSSFSSSLAYEEIPRDSGWPQAFIDDFEARFWMTYRSDFEPIPRSSDPKASSALSLTMRIKSQLGDQAGFSTDSGWGCMIRSGQSLLANTLGLLRFGRDWRRGQHPLGERELLKKFADDPRALFSIHSFVNHGATTCGKYPGEWFGPSATARCIEALVNPSEPTLRVYTAGDGHDVYEDSFMKVAKPDGGAFQPTLILVGTRLGIEKITPVYWEALVAALQMPQSVGIAGGRPSSAHYFAGAQGSFLFYLDPHHTRKALPYHENTSDYTDEEVDSCHTSRLRRVHVREMDPSMLIGFLICSEDDWTEWRKAIKHVQGKAIIHVTDSDPARPGAVGYEGREEAIHEVEPLSDDDDDDDDDDDEVNKC